MAEFKNPQQEPGMERRLLVVFALTFLVILLFQPLLKKFGPQPAAKPETSQAPAQNPAQLPLPTPMATGAAVVRAPGASGKKKAAASAPQQPAAPPR